MKICRDCKHYLNYRDRDNDFNWARCIAPKNKIIKNRVSGREILRYEFCTSHRKFSWADLIMFRKKCGVRGRWFEPR